MNTCRGSLQLRERTHPADRNEHRGKVVILSASLTFVGVWMYATFAFGALGAIVGWVPAAPLAALIGALLFYLWRPIAVAAVIWFGFTAIRLFLTVVA